MAKFIKSIFQTTDRKKPRQEEPEDDKSSSTPPNSVSERRKLSISRSGRMRQANKKRNSLSLELYNEGLEMSDKLKGVDSKSTHNQISLDSKTQEKNPRSQTPELVNTEEEIDNAFAIIDKT